MSVFSYAARVRDLTIANVNHRLAVGDFHGSPSYRAVKSKGKSNVRGVKGREKNVRTMLMEIGKVGSFNAELAIPQMFLMPRTTDPDAQATIITVEGVQRALGLEVSGILAPETVQALRRVSGANWPSKTWLQIYGDIADAQKRGYRPVTETGMGDYVSMGDAFTTVPLVTLLGGAALLFLALKGK